MESRTGSCILPRILDDSQSTSEPTATLMRPCMTIQEDPKDAVASVLRAHTWAGFRHIYGWLGVPIFFVFVLSAVWMTALAVVQLKPTYVANRLMDTAQFDFGEFWTLPKPDDRTAIVAIVALVLFAVSYVSIAVFMVFPDKLLSSATLATGRSSSRLRSVSAMIIQPQGTAPPASVCAQASAMPSTTRRTSTFVHVGRCIMYDTNNPMLALPKPVFQTVTLFTYLDEGFPATLVFSYLSLLLINWLLSGYCFIYTRPDPFLVISRFCYSFDMFFAAPMQVLVYSYTGFQFDREVFATRIAALNPSSFERTARLYADPTEISLFRIAFQHLQLTTATSLIIMSVLNVLTIIKWRHVIIHLVQLSMIPREEIMNASDDRPQPKHWQVPQSGGSLAHSLVAPSRRFSDIGASKAHFPDHDALRVLTRGLSRGAHRELFNDALYQLAHRVLSNTTTNRVNSPLVATQIFTGFDLFFAVFAPLQVLVYAYYSFSFKRDVFMTRLETLTADSFGLTARLFADPTEVSLFRIAFRHL